MYETTNKTRHIRKVDLLYPELSYEILNVLFEVYKELGSGYQEKVYQKAIASELRKRGIKFEEQLPATVSMNDEVIAKYLLDFLIDSSVVLEIKKDKNFSRTHLTQVHSYLKATNLKLGILANFTNQGVRYKRIINER